MDFAHVDGKLTVMKFKAAKEKFAWLTTELGVREDNGHVGTGLGGNNFQLMVLMGFDQHLVDDNKIDIEVHKDHLAWGAKWFLDAKKKDIRHQLDKVFPAIKEKKKYLAVALEALSHTANLREEVIKYSEHFPRLIKAIEGRSFKFNGGLTNIDQLLLAFVMCQELSAHLDRDDMSLVQPIAEAMTEFPLEVILLSVRRFVGIERMVKFNLDEDRIFGKMLTRVNRAVDK